MIPIASARFIGYEFSGITICLVLLTFVKKFFRLPFVKLGNNLRSRLAALASDMKTMKLSKKIENLASSVRIEGSKKCDEQREELEKAFLDRIRRKTSSGVLQKR